MIYKHDYWKAQCMKNKKRTEIILQCKKGMPASSFRTSIEWVLTLITQGSYIPVRIRSFLWKVICCFLKFTENNFSRATDRYCFRITKRGVKHSKHHLTVYVNYWSSFIEAKTSLELAKGQICMTIEERSVKLAERIIRWFFLHLGLKFVKTTCEAVYRVSLQSCRP